MNYSDMAVTTIDMETQQTAPGRNYGELFHQNRYLIAGITAVFLFGGVAYALLARPVYQSDILIQVEENQGVAKNALTDLSSMFAVKTAASAQIEVLRSRMVLSRAVESTKLYLYAQPHYFPVIGRWVATHFGNLAWTGFGGYVWGPERISLASFDMPASLNGVPFTLTALGNGNYRLTDETHNIDLRGRVGQLLQANVRGGRISLLVDQLVGRAGARFDLARASELAAVQSLQGSLLITEKGKDSDVIGVALQGSDPKKISEVLNAIGSEYVTQNVNRTTEEAEKSIAFLDRQLPELKTQLEGAESRFNAFRAEHGTVDLNAEASSLLARSAEAQSKVADLQQQRTLLLERFTIEHPAVRSIDDQITEASEQVAAFAAATKKMPPLEQGLLRLQRDVQVATELYTNLLNSQEQLRLLKAGKVGNVRMIDGAIVPESPIRPKRLFAVLGALLAGLFVSVSAVLFKRAVVDRVGAAEDIEHGTGLTVFAKVPRSKAQEMLMNKLPTNTRANLVLANQASDDAAIESLRSFRSALEYVLVDAPNRIVMLAGPTPVVGKSFVSVNLAALIGGSGQRVLLVDTDLRRGALHRYLGTDASPGITELVMGGQQFEEVVRRSILPGVDFVACGEWRTNPSEILMHRDFLAFMRRAESEYDIVLIDSPPILPVADSGIVAKLAGTVFMVARYGVSSLADMRESARRFAQIGVPIRGVIFNDMSRPARYTREYGTYGSAGPAGGDFRDKGVAT